MFITATHEMGHALGYAGHSYNTEFAVMNGSYKTYEFQVDEVEHLKQIWDIFYE